MGYPIRKWFFNHVQLKKKSVEMLFVAVRTTTALVCTLKKERNELTKYRMIALKFFNNLTI